MQIIQFFFVWLKCWLRHSPDTLHFWRWKQHSVFYGTKACAVFVTWARLEENDQKLDWEEKRLVASAALASEVPPYLEILTIPAHRAMIRMHWESIAPYVGRGCGASSSIHRNFVFRYSSRCLTGQQNRFQTLDCIPVIGWESSWTVFFQNWFRFARLNEAPLIWVPVGLRERLQCSFYTNEKDEIWGALIAFDWFRRMQDSFCLRLGPTNQWQSNETWWWAVGWIFFSYLHHFSRKTATDGKMSLCYINHFSTMSSLWSPSIVVLDVVVNGIIYFRFVARGCRYFSRWLRERP